jgi:hypothetical protein
MKVPTIPLLFVAAFLLSSCTSFERQWRQSVADYQTGKVAAPAGPWTGTWTTSTNGHTGNLRAIVSPAEDKPGEYDFRYHATWAKILSGSYKVRYPVTKRGGTHHVDGEQKMGVFGTFRHRASITRDRFDATYSNDKGDLGKFSLRRPE